MCIPGDIEHTTSILATVEYSITIMIIIRSNYSYLVTILTPSLKFIGFYRFLSFHVMTSENEKKNVN